MNKSSRITVPNILNVFIITLSLIGLVTLCAFIYSAAQTMIWFFTDTEGCLGSEPYSKNTIEQVTELSIPENAQNLKVQSTNSGDNCYSFIEFQILANDLEPFLTLNNIKAIAPTQGSELSLQTYLMKPNQGMKWTIEDTKTYLYGRSSGENGTSQSIVTDTSDSVIYKVYIITVRIMS